MSNDLGLLSDTVFKAQHIIGMWPLGCTILYVRFRSEMVIAASSLFDSLRGGVLGFEVHRN